MAAPAAVTKFDAGLNNFGTADSTGFVSFTASGSGTTGGALIPVDDKDCYTLLLFTCSADDNTITIKGGDGTKGGQDFVVDELKSGTYAGFVIDSAFFKITSGTNKGKVLITGKTTTSVMAIELKAGR